MIFLRTSDLALSIPTLTDTDQAGQSLYSYGTLKLETSWILISIRPDYADAILAGLKQVEFRRSPPRIAGILRALMYVTQPTAMIKAILDVQCVVRGSARDIIVLAEGDPFFPDHYVSYLQGAKRPGALVLGDVYPLHPGFSLSNLSPKAAAPRSWRYLPNFSTDSLRRNATSSQL